MLADLLPPAEPSSPYGYDFRRHAYYEQIGAYGQAFRPPEQIETGAGKETTPPSVSQAQIWRERTSATIQSHISGAEGAIAVALMTGERSAIDDKTNDDMRAAGTAHMLSISGMHISMVGGFVFVLIRSLLALSSTLALRAPIKQISAFFALITVNAYTLLVGAPIPAQRAALMTSFVFLAVLLNRQALSMRTIALAGALVLLAFPESLLNPGFQMSFAAITLLIAAYEKWTEPRLLPLDEEEGRPLVPQSTLSKISVYIGGIVVSSLIAGAATMPYGSWHFHRIQLLGVLGNLVAVPLTGLFVMPPLVLAYPLMAIGLEWIPLKIMEFGLKGVTVSADIIAQIPGANIVVPAFPLWVLIIITAGGLGGAIWRPPSLRWIGAGIVLFGAFLVPLTYYRPLAVISPQGTVAVRSSSDKKLYSDRSRTRGLTARDWSLAYNSGDQIENWRRAPENEFLCDQLGCLRNETIATVAEATNRRRIAIPQRATALMEDCRRAKIIIAPTHRAPTACRNDTSRIVIDWPAVREHGSFLLFDNGQLVSSRPNGSVRPWQPNYDINHK